MTISVLKQPWWFGMLHAKPNTARAARLLEPVSMKLRMFQTQWGHRQICRNLQEKSLIHNAKTMVSCEFPLKSIELSLRVKNCIPTWPNISFFPKTLLAKTCLILISWCRSWHSCSWHSHRYKIFLLLATANALEAHSQRPDFGDTWWHLAPATAMLRKKVIFSTRVVKERRNPLHLHIQHPIANLRKRYMPCHTIPYHTFNAIIHTCIHAYMHACMHPYIHPSIHIHIYIYTHTPLHTHIHTHIHIYIHPYIHTSIHPYIHPYIHPSIHTYTFLAPFIKGLDGKNKKNMARSLAANSEAQLSANHHERNRHLEMDFENGKSSCLSSINGPSKSIP